MNCDEWRAAIAALATGGTTSFDSREIRAHADSCAACGRQRDAIILGAPTAARPRSSDLAGAVVEAARRSDRAAVAPALRAALVLTAVVMLALHAPELIFGGDHEIAEHTARHAAACPVAFAVALVVVALRPSRARGLLPVTAALAAVLLVTGAIDIGRGSTPILAEADHLTEIAGAALVWLTAHSVSHPTRRTPPRSARHLRVART